MANYTRLGIESGQFSVYRPSNLRKTNGAAPVPASRSEFRSGRTLSRPHSRLSEEVNTLSRPHIYGLEADWLKN
jgi:hypothetical protein